MDSVEGSAVTPSKSRLSRAFAKAFNAQANVGVASDGGMKKAKSSKKKDPSKNNQIEEDEELRDKIVKEAFLAQLFAGMTAVKAAYAQLQFAQSPYDADGIQSADQTVVSELKNLSELKQNYLKKQLDDKSPENTLLLSEIQEQKSLLKIFEITNKKLDSQLKLKDSEITFLKEKLAEAVRDNKSLEKKLNSSGQLSVPDGIQLSDLRPSHFIAYFWLALKSIRSFVRLLISEMQSADWNLDDAASAIEPGISFWKPSHKCYAFESFVCKEMFDGFNHPNFSTRANSKPEQENHDHRLCFDSFMELKSVRSAAAYLAQKPKSPFATFCRTKYLRLVHPKMETSFFGNLVQRDLVDSGFIPETPFFLSFSEMAKRIWLLHCLALSFNLEVSTFQASKGTRFSEVYMDSLSDEAFLRSDGTDPQVAFTVVPGFWIGKTVVQCQVYLG